MQEIMKHQLQKIEEQEKKSCTVSKTKNNSFVEKLEKKIPPSLEKKLNKAFFHAFKMVFQKGTGIIEKTYDKEKRKEDYDIQDFAFKRRRNKKTLNKINLKAGLKKWENIGITACEGTALGLFGIGLPDIPIFTAVLLKSVYEIAMNYGFSYEDPEERYYILQLIDAALSDGKERYEKIIAVDEIAAKIEKQIEIEEPLEKQIEKTSNRISEEILYSKFLQTIPIAGVIGGYSNAKCLNKISAFAGLKYQKRYLKRKLE